MDPESDSQGAIIAHENDVKVTKVRINQGPYWVLAIFFIAAFAGNIVGIVLGVPMFDHCYSVALVVMVLGSVLGLLQVNIKLKKIGRFLRYLPFRLTNLINSTPRFK